MGVFIGLSTHTINEAKELLETCKALGIESLDECSKVMTDAEFRKLKLVLRVQAHPEMNLFLQHPSTL